MDPIYIGSDHFVRYDGARDSATGVYLNSGTCTYELFTAAGASLGTGTLSYVSASNGNYRGTIESTVTSGLTLGAAYRVVIVFEQGSYNDRRTLRLRAADRDRE